VTVSQCSKMDHRALFGLWLIASGCFSPLPIAPPTDVPTGAWVFQPLDPGAAPYGRGFDPPNSQGPLSVSNHSPLFLYAFSETREALQIPDELWGYEAPSAPRRLSTSRAGFAGRRYQDGTWQPADPNAAPALGLAPFDWDRCARSGGCAGDDDALCKIPCEPPTDPGAPEAAVAPCNGAACLPDPPSACAPTERRVALACEPTGDGCPITEFADAPPGTIYVDANAASPGDGSLALPYRTLGEALQAGTSTIVALAVGRYPFDLDPTTPLRLIGACEETVLELGTDPLVAQESLRIEHLTIESRRLALDFGPGVHALDEVTVRARSAARLRTDAAVTFDRVRFVGENGVTLEPRSSLTIDRSELESTGQSIVAETAAELSITRSLLVAGPGASIGVELHGSEAELAELRFVGPFAPAISLVETSTATIRDVVIEDPYGGMDLRRSRVIAERLAILRYLDRGIRVTARIDDAQDCAAGHESSLPVLFASDLQITQSDTPSEPCSFVSELHCGAITFDCGGGLFLTRGQTRTISSALYLGELSWAEVGAIDVGGVGNRGILIDKTVHTAIQRARIRESSEPAIYVDDAQQGGGEVTLERLLIEDVASTGIFVGGGRVRLSGLALRRGGAVGVEIERFAEVDLDNGVIEGFGLGIDLAATEVVPSLAASLEAYRVLRQVSLLPGADVSTPRLLLHP
jgi:hypothetical protein